MNLINTSSTYWYAIYVKSRHEFHVFERLSMANIDAFLPTVERLSKVEGQKEDGKLSTFSGLPFCSHQ